jgi:hypothetical protein
MRKTRRGVSRHRGESVEPVPEIPRDDPKGPEASATLVIKGTTQQVRENMGSDGTLPVEPEEEGEIPFADAIKNPENTVVVSRIAPRKQNGVKLNIEVYKEKCPLTLPAIEEAVFSESGGKRFRVAVLDPDEHTIAARVIETDVEPVIPAQPETTQQQPGQVLAGEGAVDPAEQVINQLDIQHEVTRRQVAIEQMRQQLRDMKGEGHGQPAADPRLIVMEENLKELQRQIADSQQKREYTDRIAALEKKIEETRRPAEDKTIALLLQQMRDDRAASDKRFETLMAKMNDDKQDAMLEELRAIKTSKNSSKSDFMESIQQFKALADTLGWKRPGDGDGDEPDDREWWKVVLEDHVPKIFAMYEEKQKKGEAPLTKEQLMAELDAASIKVTNDIRARQQLAARLPAPAVPVAPVVPPAPGAPAAAPPVGPPPMQELTGPPPLSDGAITVDLAPSAAQRPPTVDEAIRARVSTTFDALDHESQIRPTEFEWSLYAWRNLPTTDGGALDRLAHADDAASALQVFVPHVAPERLKSLADRLQADAKLAPWIQRGLDDLREWWGELAKDPNFNPEDDGEPEPDNNEGA